MYELQSRHRKIQRQFDATAESNKISEGVKPKESYYRQAVKNCAMAVKEFNQFEIEQQSLLDKVNHE